MKITRIEAVAVSAIWKNWLFVRVQSDGGVHGIGEGTFNGFIRTMEAAVNELVYLAIGEDSRNVNALAKNLMEAPRLGLELNLKVAAEYPHDHSAYRNVHEKRWDKRLGQTGKAQVTLGGG